MIQLKHFYYPLSNYMLNVFLPRLLVRWDRVLAAPWVRAVSTVGRQAAGRAHGCSLSLYQRLNLRSHSAASLQMSPEYHSSKPPQEASLATADSISLYP